MMSQIKNAVLQRQCGIVICKVGLIQIILG